MTDELYVAVGYYRSGDRVHTITTQPFTIDSLNSIGRTYDKLEDVAMGRLRLTNACQAIHGLFKVEVFELKTPLLTINTAGPGASRPPVEGRPVLFGDNA